MAGTVTVLGEFDVAACYPTMVGLIAAMETDAAARMQGCLAMSGSVAVNLPTLEGTLAALAAVSDQITTGGVALNFAVQAELIATLAAQIAAMAALTAAFGLSGAKAEVFQYSGTANSFGAACNDEAGSGIQGGAPTDQMQAVVIMTRYPAFLEAFMAVFLA